MYWRRQQFERERKTPEDIQNHNIIRDHEKRKSDGELSVGTETKRVTIRPWEEDAGPTGENVKAQVRRRLYGK
jgi:hypothetical protein